MRSRSGWLLSAFLGGLALSACGDPCHSGPGTICTWAGTSEIGFVKDGVDARSAALYYPMGTVVDARGDLIVCDWSNHRVRSIDHATHQISTVIGNLDIGDGPNEEDGTDTTPAPGIPGSSCSLNHPTDLALLPNGDVLVVCWHNFKIRHFSPASGNVYVEVGKAFGISDGTGTAASFSLPSSVALDSSGTHAFIVDQPNERVRRIDLATDQVVTVAGTGATAPGYGGDDGPPLQAQFGFSTRYETGPAPAGGIAMDAAGNVYVADTLNDRIRVIDPAGATIKTFAGTGTSGYSGDGGPAGQATLNHPRGLRIGPDGNLYLADTDNHVIRKIDLGTQVITTVAGNGQSGWSGDSGHATQAALNRPFGLSFDPQGNLFISDTFNSRIRRVEGPL